MLHYCCRHEQGEYYAIDFGGTNLRLLYTQLSAEPKAVVSIFLRVQNLVIRTASHCSRFSALQAHSK